MFKRKWPVVVFSLLVSIALLTIAWAQANQWSTITPSGSVSSCPATATGQDGQCAVTDGYYFSVGGGPYQKALTSGSVVSSFNNRSGAVVPATGDYSFAQVSGQLAGAQMPATVTCNMEVTVNGTTQTVTLSGCH